MATKTLTITEHAYNRLAALKEKNESFSNVIIRITSASSLHALVGLLSTKEAEALRQTVKELRKQGNDEIEQRTRRAV